MPSDSLSPERVADIVEAQFPELKPITAGCLGEGYDSTAFDVNERWVFRFPKRDDVAQQHLAEIELLPLLAPHVRVPIPQFRYHGQPSRLFPRHFAGYPKLAGVPGIQLDPARIRFRDLAPVLAEFLSALHSFPRGELSGVNLPEYSSDDLMSEAGAEAISDLHRVTEVLPDAPIAKWRTYLESLARESAQPALALVHGDLAAEHILLDPETQEVTGVIDWSEVALGDPILDFAGLFHWGGAEFANAVLSRYRPAADAGLLDRARYLGACRGVGDVGFGLKTGRPEYTTAGIRALRLCIET